MADFDALVTETEEKVEEVASEKEMLGVSLTGGFFIAIYVVGGIIIVLLVAILARMVIQPKPKNEKTLSAKVSERNLSSTLELTSGTS